MFCFCYVIFFAPFLIEGCCFTLSHYRNIAISEIQKDPNTPLTGEDIVRKFKKTRHPICGTPEKISTILNPNHPSVPIFWMKVPYYLNLNLRDYLNLEDKYIILYSKPNDIKAIKSIPASEFNLCHD